MLLNIQPILTPLKPRKALNKAFLKVKPQRSDIERFKANLIQLLDRINDAESEEFHKNLVIDFLKKTYYEPRHFINTKGRNDLVIHNGNKANTTVGVIIEAKKPTNKHEMISREKINVKAFHELILYYLRERITHKNLEIKYLAATNINEWFIFDANIFEKYFAQNKELVHRFTEFENNRLSGNTTDFFYHEIAAPFVAELKQTIEFTYFDIRDYEKPLRNNNPKDDNQLIALFKLLSPEHLLKLPFANDSNTLDKRFYGELLHIIGLTETKQGSKKLIERNKPGARNSGSLLENAIIQIDSLDKLSQLNHPNHFGATKEERLFNVALELSITWINRILFLKLLEAQLQTYHKSDKSYEFLNLEKINNYDDLNSLFFQVLACKQNERNADVKTLFAKVPFLNSSLFDPTGIEHATLFISNLRDDKKLPIYSASVLKDKQGKKRSGELTTLEYIFEFLNAYDFSSEGSEDIQEDNKALINASVLGLIFEKINGYKDGSFFTPGFITMYMCRETIRRAVVQKFNETKNWNCKDLDELYDKIENRSEANKIINELKICDPAVGSGHFLVSALNEIIAIKNDLKILQDRNGKRLKEYHVEVVNDELIITDEDGELFEYNVAPHAPLASPQRGEKAPQIFGEKQRIQETLFHEKQTIIENCLFGVDINPNSVKICRLRLWIELLKNAYYKNETELETLPNIDINIKCGNSLISRFDIDADLSQALKKSKWNVDSYKLAVATYRNAENKEQKREMEKLIKTIKTDFESNIETPFKAKIAKARGEVEKIFTEINTKKLWGENITPAIQNNLEKATQKLAKLEEEKENVQNNKIYEGSFEWRFEFPEVLDDNGDFMGFDVVIGNPPYGVSIKGAERIHLLTAIGKVPDYEIYYWFIDRSHQILKKKGLISLIIPNSILFNVFAQEYRLNLFDRWEINEILDCTDFNIFEDATVRNIIFQFIKNGVSRTLKYRQTNDVNSFDELITNNKITVGKELVEANNNNWGLIFKLSPDVLGIVKKIKEHSKPLSEIFPETSQGLIAYDKYRGQSQEIIKSRAYHSFEKTKITHKQWLYGEDVTRYSLIWNGKEYIEYDEGIANPRDPKFFIGKRILIREITNPRIYAALTIEEAYNDPAIIIVKENTNDFNIESLLAILNSKLATFYHFNSSPKATKGAFPKILVYDVNNFPLPINITEEVNEKLKNLVNEIISMKKENPKADTSALEAEIDQLVYELYGLTEDEIKIVEGV